MTTTTIEDARAAIHGRLDTFMNASYAGTKVEYTNRVTVDLSTQKLPYVACDIVWVDGEQMSMELTPVKRRLGAIWLHVGVKQGGGTKDALAILSALIPQFEIQTFGGVRTQAAQPMAGFQRNGWWYERVRVPFYINDIP